MGKADVIILCISCCLSMIGSSCVGLTTLYPVENRRKIGKVLLFWLSISDFFTSFIYFIQVFDPDESNSDFCKAVSLLGIFFPVSSFLWTDLIAYYLYSVIANRNNGEAINWDLRMKYYHFFVWGVSGFIITIVGFSNRAGRDIGNSWCWIRDSNPSSLFVWELVGGKLIEWTSCFIILPVFYALAAWQLRKIEQTDSNRSTISTTNNQILVSAATSPPRSTILRTNLLSPQASPPVQNRQEDAKAGKLFGKFYLKMAAVPVVFLFIRFWGSLRVVMKSLRAPASNASWLHFMVDAFDPSQGFFNAVLFVGLSNDGQRSIFFALSLFIATCFYFIPGATSLSVYLRSLTSKSPHSGADSGDFAAAAEFGKYKGHVTDLTNAGATSVVSQGGVHSIYRDDDNDDFSENSFGSTF